MGGAGGGSDAFGLGNMMKMAQQFSGMGNFMNNMNSGSNKKGRSSKSRKLRRRLKKKLGKKNK